MILRLLAALSLGMALPVGARAATPTPTVPSYFQYSCRSPSEDWIGADRFVANLDGSAQTGARDACATGGQLELWLSTTTSGPNYAEWTYAAPPHTVIVGASIARQASLPSGSNMQYALVGTTEACQGPGCYLENRDIPGTRASLTFRLSCPGTGCSTTNPSAPSTGTLTLGAGRIQLSDQEPPKITVAPSGGLFAEGATVDGAQTVAFSAEDLGGGVYKAALVVDGLERTRQVVDDNGGACREPFVKAVPCKPSAAGRLVFDTSQVTDGRHTFSLVVYDATGTNSATFGPVSVTVANRGGGSSASGTPAARLVGIRRPVRRQPYPRRALVAGRLVDASGSAIAGAGLAVFSAVEVPGAAERQIGSATTDAKGRFGFVVPRGPSRRISVRYRPAGASTDAAASTVRVVVAAPVALVPSARRLRNGQRLTLTARLGGRRVPAGSADVAFQVLIGTRWRTFATRSLDAHGRARVHHRFRVTYQRLTYRFRAVTLRRRNFPFADSASRPVGVRVN